jgi:hypothetical protein
MEKFLKVNATRVVGQSRSESAELLIPVSSIQFILTTNVPRVIHQVILKPSEIGPYMDMKIESKSIYVVEGEISELNKY